jgi:predicted acyltransferase
LSTIPAVAHVLIGFWVMSLLMNIKDNREKMNRLFIYGAIFTFVGFLFSYACPINKKIWSPSFVLVACGMGATLFSLLIWIIDVNHKKKWSVFFESFGANPLFLYVFGSFLAILIDTVTIHDETLKSLIFNGMCSLNMNIYFASCLFAILFVTVCWVVGRLLYKHGIYIKI